MPGENETDVASGLAIGETVAVGVEQEQEGEQQDKEAVCQLEEQRTPAEQAALISADDLAAPLVSFPGGNNRSRDRE